MVLFKARGRIKAVERKRNSLVPLDEALADLSGPVKAIRKASPQALHHFTLADQVNQLVEAREADADLGLGATILRRLMVTHDIGVRRKLRYEVKRIDEGYLDLESL